MGKGSKPRPRQVPEEVYAANYDRIFRRPAGIVPVELPLAPGEEPSTLGPGANTSHTQDDK